MDWEDRWAEQRRRRERNKRKRVRGIALDIAVVKEKVDKSPLTRREIAEACGVKLAAVKSWIRGTCQPTPEHYERFKKALGVRSNVMLDKWEMKERANPPPSYKDILKIGRQLRGAGVLGRR